MCLYGSKGNAPYEAHATLPSVATLLCESSYGERCCVPRPRGPGEKGTCRRERGVCLYGSKGRLFGDPRSGSTARVSSGAKARLSSETRAALPCSSPSSLVKERDFAELSWSSHSGLCTGSGKRAWWLPPRPTPRSLGVRNRCAAFASDLAGYKTERRRGTGFSTRAGFRSFRAPGVVREARIRRGELGRGEEKRFARTAAGLPARRRANRPS